MKFEIKSLFIPWVIYLMLAFPMFYFVYKFGNPKFGANDFFDYYPMYRDLKINGVNAPFNMRLVSSFFVYLLNKMNLHYDTECIFDQFKLDKQVFFNAILFNYLCVVCTCTIIFRTIAKYFKNVLLAFISGMLYLLGFGTLFYEFMPITDSLSVLIFAISFSLYLSRNYFIVIPLLILILQREYILLAFGLIALLDYFKVKSKYYLYVMAICVVCLVIYYILRKTIFYTAYYDFQASPTFFITNFFTVKFPIVMYFRQLLLTLNVFILYLLVIFYKKMKNYPIDAFNLLKVILLFLQINLVTFAGGFGNNAGRIFYFVVPLIIFYLIKEVSPLIKSQEPTPLVSSIP